MVRRVPAFAFACAVLALSASAYAGGKPVDFQRDIRPIIANKCLLCHGPDDKNRKAGLRLDVREGAVKELKSGAGKAVVVGKPMESELFVRITATDPALLMPPAKHGKPLSEAEIDAVKRWIEAGAPYAQHWSYVKPVRPPLPEVKDKAWLINPIDNFILARLEKEGLRPNPAADRYVLARRAAIDLTGLPPTIEMADEFVRDQSANAYEKYIDRLLAMPSYGERWAQSWLDLARYADSQGYANDPDRQIWGYRDWVVRALNDNMPFDRFTIEQLAGDMLPNPTTDQLVATGFHRNTLTNTEGGTNPEEFRSAAIVDRVNTTMQVWMGTTIACSQCHNHKYDPLSQKEFFRLYAILNNTADNNGGDDAPTLSLAIHGQEAERKELEAKLAAAKKELDREAPIIDGQFAEWEETAAVDAKAYPKELADLLAKPADKRDKKKLAEQYRHLWPAWKSLDGEVKNLTAKYNAVTLTTPIMREGTARKTHIQLRGNFLDKGEEVTPGLPAVFPQPAAGAPMNRLTLATWLVDGNNPLTGRVAANRLWEEIFGIGLVETSEEFGAQGDLPTHPELLDWLATEYVRLNWDTKAMLKLLVTSAAYRQNTHVTADLAARDPFNRLVARGPRVRLAGEAVRDQALFVSGLLSPKMYGPPVQPPKPSFGLSAAFGGTTDWTADTGENRWRRGLYIRWRRNAPYPSLTTFDAPERTSCTVRRIRTNTPLQALVTLNDPVFVEAAQAFARKIAAQGGAATAERVVFAFRTCLTRPPSDVEAKRLAELFDKAKAEFAAAPAKATAMATKPLGPAPKGADVAELAAWTVVANVLLNLDETLAKR